MVVALAKSILFGEKSWFIISNNLTLKPEEGEALKKKMGKGERTEREEQKKMTSLIWREGAQRKESQGAHPQRLSYIRFGEKERRKLKKGDVYIEVERRSGRISRQRIISSSGAENFSARRLSNRHKMIPTSLLLASQSDKNR